MKKCTHGGHPLEFPLLVKLPHVISLHQSAPLMESVNPVARSVWAHSSLISCPVQDGELLAVYCVVLRANCCSDWYVEDSPPPANGPWMFQGTVPQMHAWRVESVGQNVPVGPPNRKKIGPRGASTPYGWWVLQLSFFGGVGPFFLIPFLIFIEVFKGFEFLRTVLWPVHLCLCPRRARLNWAARFWVPNCSC